MFQINNKRGYLVTARRLVSIGEGGGVIESGERRAISYKNKLVDVLNKQRTGVLSNSPKAYKVVRVKERIY
jgi:hypothetical protein